MAALRIGNLFDWRKKNGITGRASMQILWAEGWKVLNDGMGVFVALVLVLISVLLLPLIGIDPKNNMQELCRGTKYGKRQLDHARILTAFYQELFFMWLVFSYILLKALL